MKHLRFAAATLLIVCGSANATLVSVGALSSNDDGSTVSIFDSKNQREWLRWDVLKGLTYAQTVALTSTGGQFDGWKIATNSDALMFLNALVGQNNCENVSFNVCTSSVSDDVRFLTGDSYSPNVAGGPLNDLDDYVYFLSDNAFGYEVGAIETLKFRRDVAPTVYFKHEHWQIADADSAGTRQGEEIGWLLYRDVVGSVAEPGTEALLALGLLVTTLHGRRNRRRSSWGR